MAKNIEGFSKSYKITVESRHFTQIPVPGVLSEIGIFQQLGHAA
jgi:hypothetical protein